MSEKRIKVTDRRMFTPEGELRDDYKTLDSKDLDAKDPNPVEPTKAESPKASGPVSPKAEPPAPSTPAGDEPEEKLESGATFRDLVGLLGQSASVYLSQASQRLENRAELLEMARMHVDLLAIVKQKTRGNLKPDEQALLDDALYQLRMAFVQQG